MDQIQATYSANSDAKAFVALGSNLSGAFETPINTLIHCLKLFSAESLKVVAQSNWYATKAFPAGSGPDYVNAVVGVETLLNAAEILAALHRIEFAMGRVRNQRWAARICDLDLLAVGQEIAPDQAGFTRWHELPLAQQKTITPDRLILPHPRMQDRGFVLVPMNDIAPDWRHPVLGQTVAEMLAALPLADVASVNKISAQ